jgi:hypothetical protein
MLFRCKEDGGIDASSVLFYFVFGEWTSALDVLGLFAEGAVVGRTLVGLDVKVKILDLVFSLVRVQAIDEDLFDFDRIALCFDSFNLRLLLTNLVFMNIESNIF